MQISKQRKKKKPVRYIHSFLVDIIYIIYLIHIHVLIRAVTWTWVTIFGAVVEFSISTNVADLLSEGLDGMELLSYLNASLV